MGKGRELVQVTRQENLGGEKGKGEGARPGDQAGELGWVNGKGERGKGRELVQVTRLESLGGVKGRELIQVTRLESWGG